MYNQIAIYSQYEDQLDQVFHSSEFLDLYLHNIDRCFDKKLDPSVIETLHNNIRNNLDINVSRTDPFFIQTITEFFVWNRNLSVYNRYYPPASYSLDDNNYVTIIVIPLLYLRYPNSHIISCNREKKICTEHLTFDDDILLREKLKTYQIRNKSAQELAGFISELQSIAQ